MIGMTHLKKNRVETIAGHRGARRRHRHHLHLCIVVVLNVQTALSMIQIQERCVVDMDRVVVRKVNAVEKDRANTPGQGIKAGILV